MVKKIFLGILILLALVIGGFFLVRFISYTADDDPYKTFILPRVEMSVVEITSLDLDKTKMLAKVLIDNPMPVTFAADSINYEIYISDVKVIESTYKESVELKASDSSWMEMPVTVFTKDLAAVLETAEAKGIDSVEYRLVATFHTNLVFKKDFSIDKTKLLPLIYIPKVEIVDVDLDSLKFKGAGLAMTISIINKNKFPLNINNLTYKFSVADEQWADGKVDEPIRIPEQGAAPVTIRLHLSFKEVGQTAWDIITAKDSMDYNLVMALKLDANTNMLKNSTVVLHSSDSVKSLLALRKKEKKEAREEKKKEREKENKKR